MIFGLRILDARFFTVGLSSNQWILASDVSPVNRNWCVDSTGNYEYPNDKPLCSSVSLVLVNISFVRCDRLTSSSPPMKWGWGLDMDREPYSFIWTSIPPSARSRAGQETDWNVFIPALKVSQPVGRNEVEVVGPWRDTLKL